MSKQSKKYLTTFLLVGLFLPSFAYALPFGAQILQIPLLCTANLFSLGDFIIPTRPIGGVNPIAVIFNPLTSALYEFRIWQKPGTYLLGEVTVIEPCLVFVPFPPYVVPISVVAPTYPPGGFRVLFMGTSL